MLDVKSWSVPNLIQGISQQSSQQRRETQCEDQLNCINSVVDGAVARPGTSLVKLHDELDLTDAFFYEVKRSPTEHYVVVVQDDSLKAFNLVSGNEAAITTPDGLTYLNIGTEAARTSFAAATVEDTTFIVNKTILPEMDDEDLSDAVANEAILYFKAGSYKTTYVLTVVHDGDTYGFTYQTPENGAASNEQYIATSSLAATFYRTLLNVGDGAALTAGASVGGQNGNRSNGAISDAGFNVSVQGSTVRIWRDDDEEFTVTSSDGLGETQMIAFKGNIAAFSDLPEHCFLGTVVKVRGEDSETRDDYWVVYEGDSVGTGQWVETIAPSTEISLVDTTMPHVLVNDGLDSFTFKKASWGDRVVGDGIDSSKTPSFVGRAVEDIVFFSGRLGMLTLGSLVLSRSKNIYVFFPDTIQTQLANAPIDSDTFNTNPSLLKKLVTAGEGLFLWTESIQLAVGSGDENLKETSIDIKPSTAFEFDNQVDPLSLGLASVYFTSQPGTNTAVRELMIRRGNPEGEVDLTEHVPRLIPSPITQLTGSDTRKSLAILSEADPQIINIYQWLGPASERVQSAWNYWTFPQVSRVLWVGFRNATMYLLMQRPDGVSIESLTMASQPRDPGGNYYTRLDHRFDETGGTWVEDEDGLGTYTVDLPYELPDDTARSVFKVVTRTTSEDNLALRGSELSFDLETSGKLTVLNVPEDIEFYAGFTIYSMREESEFFVRDDRGVVPLDSIRIRAFTVLHSSTGYYRIEVVKGDGTVSSEEYNGRLLGDPSILNQDVAITNGKHKKNVDLKTGTFTLRIVNDSVFPSNWQSAQYTYAPTKRSS